MNSRAEINIARAGEFFIYCLWIQGQMVDLIIFKKGEGKMVPMRERTDSAWCWVRG
jgi:hypothetical protein